MAQRRSYMDKAVHLLSFDAEGAKWQIQEHAIRILQEIQEPVTVISIIGYFRTGKSYFLNKLLGQKSCFKLGSLVTGETKGIWMYAKPHPVKADQCLIVLDTEGLGDIDREEENFDKILFCLTLLISNTFIVNIKERIDDALLKELEFVSTLAETIRARKNGDITASNATLEMYLPKLVILIRDFFLELRDKNGQEITSNQYLENALHERPGESDRVKRFNTSRRCIKKYFPERSCHVLPRPVEGEIELRNLSINDEVKESFANDCNLTTEEILKKAEPMKINGQTLLGSIYFELVKSYVDMVNRKDLPCIESTLELVSYKICQQAKKSALDYYHELMDKDNRDPLSVEAFEKRHAKVREGAWLVYHKHAVLGENQELAISLEEEIEVLCSKYQEKNLDLSRVKCAEAMERCFGKLERRLKDGEFSKRGGYSEYKEKLQLAIHLYNAEQNLGPLKAEELLTCLKKQEVMEKVLIAADEALSDAEKQREEEQLRQNQQKEHIKLLKQQAENMELMMVAREQQHQEIIEVLKTQYEERLERSLKEYKDLIQNAEKQLAILHGDELSEKQKEILYLKDKIEETEAKRKGFLHWLAKRYDTLKKHLSGLFKRSQRGEAK